MNNREDFASFLHSLNLTCLIEKQGVYLFPEKRIKVIFRDIVGEEFNTEKFPVDMSHMKSEENDILSENFRSIHIYEDIWVNNRVVIIERIKAVLLPDKSIYARNCTVKKITSDVADSFMDSNHLLGRAKAKFKYGLFYKDNLIAVALFSKPRPITRDGLTVSSYEWVRYASAGSLRVAGGASKLFKHFCRSVDPDEVMSYADAEWSEGDMYKKIGFVYLSKTEPIKFAINRVTLKRVYFRKTLKSDLTCCDSNHLILFNHGNLKFLWSRS